MWAAVLGLAAAVVAVVILRFRAHPLRLTGAVIRQDIDPHKELPIADVEITAENGLAVAPCKSDASGFFILPMRPGVIRGRAVKLRFEHADYQPLVMDEVAGDELYIAHMVPIPHERPQPNHPEITVANVLVRYSIKATTTGNIGSAVKAFQVKNSGNVPCNGQHPCSPDGKWKAAIDSASLDAGEGNEFINARASCIAGPCPFTRIENDNFSHGGRQISVSARDWSDTATFMLEAEVIHPMVSDIVRRSFPVTFGEALNFTLPASAQGVSIQAEMNGDPIVFPLGPRLYLSWAECNVRVNRDQTRVFRCELKAGYRFR